MGLPLFIAPVESDLPPKAADKNNALSPSRSSIRRHARQNSRERRAAMRRHITIRDRVGGGAHNLRQSSTISSREGRLLPWVESGFPPTNDSSTPDPLRRPRPFREILREMTRGDDERRERLEEQMNTWFGTGWQDDEPTNGPGEEDRQEVDGGWWSAESRPRYARARIVGAVRRNEDISRPRRRTSPLVRQWGESRSSANATETSQRRSYEARSISRENSSDANERERRRAYVLHRIRAFDGLGDRDRSLSPDGLLNPEGWDTLLTTLTPDPQPPSAGSSFASNAASQSAGPSSHTSVTTSGPVTGDNVPDPACESGCENSDTEEHEAPVPRRRPQHRRMTGADLHREFGRDGPVDSPADEPSREFSFEVVGGGTFPARQIRRRHPDRPPLDHIVFGGGESGNERNSEGETALPFARLHGLRNGWIGQLSVGSSEDEQGAERRRLTREGSSTSGNNTSNEEDWSGMQRIVRSLARREDIPDEWWAEAGLSRNLPHDGTDL